MNNSTPQITNTKIVELAKTYWAWRRLWIATTIAFGGFGLAYVVFLKSDMWTASQGLIVRDEANGAVMRLGRFQSQTEMKAAQETIFEMARNTLVLREALLDVGPAKSMLGMASTTKNWPTQTEVRELADEAIGVRAPKGAEFGTTEVIYLDIKQPSRERAIQLNQAVCKALDNRLRQVRVARADGVINELARAGTLASAELQKATEQLQVVEREAGADLSDLRGLSEANGNGNTSRQLLDTVKTELRQLENQHNLLLTDYALLRETQTDPEKLMSAPASILNAHPGLKKLREGLADAQLNSSQLRGRFTSTHPLVSVALTSEQEIKIRLQGELALALATAGKDVENSQARIDNLKRQQRQLEERLERLARIRADHDNLNQETRARTTILQDVERQLADARAARDAALTSSLLTRLDEPVLGERPAGPGRSTILAGMTLAGLCFGLGIVFLLTPLDGDALASDRWNEKLGRRLSDRFPWLADQPTSATTPLRRRNDYNRRQVGATMPDPVANASAEQGGRRADDQAVSPSTIPPQTAAGERRNALTPSELSALAPIGLSSYQHVNEPALESISQTTSHSVVTPPLFVSQAIPVQAVNAPALKHAQSASDQSPSAAPVTTAPVSNASTAPLAAAAPQVAKPAPQVAKPAPQVAKPAVGTAPQNVSRPQAVAQSNPVVQAPPMVPAAPLVQAPPVGAQVNQPVRTSMNMFRPNQASAEAEAATLVPERGPMRSSGFQSSGPVAGTPTPGDEPIDALAFNGFETPIGGGLAAIGMPTQPLPQSFGFRPSP